MKRIKYIISIGGFFLLISGLIIFELRSPSYTIETNGNLYILNKLSSSITVFDLFEGKELVEFPMEIEPHEATILSDQNMLVVTNYGKPDVNGKSISVISTKTNEIVKTIDLEGSLKPHGIFAFPGSGKVGLITDLSNELLVVDIETGIVEKKIPTNQEMSHLLVLHPNKPLAYVTNVNSNSVSVVDLTLDKVIKTIPCGLGTEGIDITPDGSEIWVTNNDENTIDIISTDNYQITHTLKTGRDPSRLKFSVNGRHCLVTNAGDGTVIVYNQDSKTQLKTISIPGKQGILEKILYHSPRPVGILMHPNGLYAFVANSNADQIEVINMQTFDIISTIGAGNIPDGLALVE
jgi:YVTN family beta-propeller protein